MMVVTSPRLSLFVLLAIPVIVLPLVGFGRAVRRRSRAAQDTLADASAYAAELIGACARCRPSPTSGWRSRRFARRGRARLRGGAATRPRARAVLTAIVIFLVFGSVVVVLWVGAQDVLAGDITPGTARPVRALCGVRGERARPAVAKCGASSRRPPARPSGCSRSCASKPEIKAPAQPVALPEPARGEVAFDDVRFAYPTRPETLVLDGVSFRVRPGEKVAIVGPSGAGKSTIFHLLLRFYDPRSGTITLRRRARRRRRSARAAPAHRAGAAGHRDLRRLGRRQHPLRPARRERRRRRARRRACAGVRIHRPAAAGLRHADRRARRHALGRPAPAHRDRARDPARRAAAAARRGDLVARRRERDAGAGRARAADGRSAPRS